MKLNELREKRETLANDLNDLADVIEKEARSFTEEEITRSESGKKEIEELDKQIKTLEDTAFIRTLSGAKTATGAQAPAFHRSKRLPTYADYNNALKAWALYGTRNVPDHFQRSADLVGIDYKGHELFIRDQSSDTATEGTEFLNGSIFQGFVEARKRFGGAATMADVFSTADASPRHYVINDDTSTTAAVSKQNTEISSDDLTYDTVTLNSFDMKTGVYKIAFQWLEDAQYDVMAHVNNTLGRRLNRTVNKLITSGGGTTEPTGFVDEVQVAVDSRSSYFTDPSNAQALINDLYDLRAGVDPDYRDSPNTAFMMTDNTLTALAKCLVDDVNRPLWQNNLSEEPGVRLLGKPVIINNELDDVVPASSKRPIFYGDWYHLKVRYVGQQVRLVRDDSYARFLAIGLLAYSRMDSRFVNPGNDPIACLSTGTISGD